MFNLKDARGNGLYWVLNSNETEQHKALESYSKTSSTIVFIDSGVDDYQSLVNGAVPEAEVIVLDSVRDGVEQITKVLQRLTESKCSGEGTKLIGFEIPSRLFGN